MMVGWHAWGSGARPEGRRAQVQVPLQTWHAGVVRPQVTTPGVRPDTVALVARPAEDKEESTGFNSFTAIRDS